MRTAWHEPRHTINNEVSVQEFPHYRKRASLPSIDIDQCQNLPNSAKAPSSISLSLEHSSSSNVRFKSRAKTKNWVRKISALAYTTFSSDMWNPCHSLIFGLSSSRPLPSNSAVSKIWIFMPRTTSWTSERVGYKPGLILLATGWRTHSFHLFFTAAFRAKPS